MQTDEYEQQASDGAIQDHYDKTFGKLTSPEHLQKTAGADELREAETGGFNKPVNSSPVASSSILAKSESNPTTNLSGKGVSSEDIGPSFRDRAGTILKSRRNKAIAAGGAGVLGLGIAGTVFFASLAPVLRINSLVQNLQDHFFAASSSATDKATNKLFQTYLVKKVMPGMIAGCTPTKISKSCAAPSNADTPVGALFNAWKDARLENKMASNYGIELRRQGNAFYFRSDQLQHDIFLGDYTPNDTKTFENKVFSRMDRNDIRAELTRGLSNETLYKRVWYRFVFGKLVDRKYNIRRCIAACAARDRAHDTLDAKKTAFKSWVNERVIGPQSEMYSLAIDCAMSNFDCTKGDEVDPEGRHLNDFDRNVNTRLADFRAKYGETQLDELYKEAQGFRDKGAADFLVEKLLEKLGTSTSVRVADVTNPIGWIDLGAHLLVGAKNAGPALKKMSYAMYAQTAVATYMMYRTSADELKAGKIDSTEHGSMVQSLDASPSNDQGGLPGESSPVYTAITGQSKTSQTAFSFSPTAFAEPVASTYKCDDGSPLPATKLACDEEKPGYTNWVGTATGFGSGVLNSPLMKMQFFPLEAWVKISDTLTGLVTSIVGAITGVLKHIPLVGDALTWAQSHVAELANNVLKAVIGYVIPSPLTNNPSGARYVQVASGGADIAANDAAHYAQGGRVLTSSEVAAIQADQQAQKDQTFNQQPLFARLFSTDLPQSLLSRLAVITPTNFSQMTLSFSSLFSNPFTHVIKGLASFVPIHQASAAAAADPFGIPQYGWADADIQKLGDPEAYWTANCSDLTAANVAWGSQATENPNNGSYDNATTNGCLLLQSTVGAAGGRYNALLATGAN